MFKVGDRVSFIFEDKYHRGTILEVLGYDQYLVSAKLIEDEYVNIVLFGDRLTLVPVIQLSADDLRCLIRFEEAIIEYFDPEEEYELKCEELYKPDLEDIIQCMKNVLNEIDSYESADDFEDFVKQFYYDDFDLHYIIDEYYDAWKLFESTADIYSFDQDALMGMLLKRLFGEENLTTDDNYTPKYIGNLLKETEAYLNTMDQDLLEINFPTIVKNMYIRNIASRDYNLELSEEEIQLFKNFVEELSESGNESAKEILGYAYYTGNKIYKNDWYKSRDIFEELYNSTGKPKYANTLGYIYYYGRCNNGVPDYDFAYKYFSFGALNGYYESTYKIADMLVHGYGVPKNLETAMRLYREVYFDTLRRIENQEFSCNFADAALRMGGAIENGLNGYSSNIQAYAYYLQADYAIKKRKIYNSYGDGVVFNRIQEGLKRIKPLLDDDDKDQQEALYNLYGLGLIGEYGYTVQVQIRYLKDMVSFTTTRLLRTSSGNKQYLLTVPECDYCNLVDHITFTSSDIYKMKIEDKSKVFIFNEIKHDHMTHYFYYDGKLTATITGGKLVLNLKPSETNQSHLYRFVSIKFNNYGKTYDYLCDDESVEIGDYVVIEGRNGDQIVEVINVFTRTEKDSPLPIGQYKTVIKKTDESSN